MASNLPTEEGFRSMSSNDGVNPEPRESRETTEVLENLMMALDAMPAAETRAFREALETVPELVEIESNPAWFLRAEDWNVERAAQRLARCWTFRKAAFRERAFLPMTLSPEGALGKKGLEALRTLFWVRLPDDSKGRPVLLRNIARLGSKCHDLLPFEERCLFFCVTWLAKESLAAQTDGFVTIMVTFGRKSHVQLLASRREILLAALPARQLSLHVCEVVPCALTSEVLPVVSHIMAAGDTDVHVHVESSSNLMFRKLQNSHLRSEGLPMCFGGTWTYDSFQFHGEAGQTSSHTGDSRRKGIKRSADVDDREPRRQKILRHTKEEPPPVLGVRWQDERDTKAVRSMLECFHGLTSVEKAACSHAMHWTPQLVEKEATPLWFLRVEDYDVKRAAARMARYWTVRKASFGDRAYLPMNLTGDGALNADSVDVLMSRFLTRLPDDDAGHPVLLHNSSRLYDVTAELLPSRGCCLFAFITLLAMDRVSAQTEGFVYLRIVANTDLETRSFERQWQLLLEAMPVKVHGIHLCCLVEGAQLNPLGAVSSSLPAPDHRVQVHGANDPSNFLTQLQPFGLRKACLPSCLGGDMPDDTYTSWLKRNIAAAREQVWSMKDERPTATITPASDNLEMELVALQTLKTSLSEALGSLTQSQQPHVAFVPEARAVESHEEVVEHLGIKSMDLQNCLIIVCFLSSLKNSLPPPVDGIGVSDVLIASGAVDPASCNVSYSIPVDQASPASFQSLSRTHESELEGNQILRVFREFVKGHSARRLVLPSQSEG